VLVTRWIASGLPLIRVTVATMIVGTVTLQACSNSATSDVGDGWQQPTTSPRATSVMRGPLAILPLPREMARLPGEMVLPSPVAIRTNGKAAHAVALQLASEFERLGVVSTVDDPKTAPATIQLTENARIQELGTEGYRLDVNGSGIKLVANTGTGLFYGAETLEQLASDDGRSALAIPYVQIVDWPEYHWRGLHLDVSRHFFPVEAVKRYIEVASHFKLNVFHWHLTDDQGWRIDIPKYPLLSSVGGCRAATQAGDFGSTTTDGTWACGYYSENDVREIVSFAEARHVQVIPEIEGPGHSVEALAAYAFLACAPGPYATLEFWGSTKYSICPTERTFQFYDDIFREVAKLFPSPIIHIGGDEVPFYSWRGAPYVTALMRREGLESYAAVQSYFTRRLEEIAHKYGKRIIGWDEIDKAGVSRDAIVMAWTGSDAALTASSHGNDVVMSPNPPLYFDAYQGPPEREPAAIGGLTTLEMVYKYNPMASIGAPEQRKHILGAQGNLWTEYIPTSSQLWYMAYPRALALSELCWTPRDRMDWNDFKKRAGVALMRLEPLRVTFRIPEVEFRLESPDVTPVSIKLNVYRAVLPEGSSNATVALQGIVPNAAIHYTLDGNVPTVSSPLYEHPLHLKVGATGVHVAAVASLKGYRISAPSFLTLAPP
jgi:hexosaminidase